MLLPAPFWSTSGKITQASQQRKFQFVSILYHFLPFTNTIISRSPKEEGKKKKKSGGKTVSSVYLVSLMELMVRNNLILVEI